MGFPFTVQKRDKLRSSNVSHIGMACYILAVQNIEESKADGLAPVVLEELGALLDPLRLVWPRTEMHVASVLSLGKCNTSVWSVE